MLFDQRGCGRSTPAGELKDNSPAHLVADIEQLREELRIDTWHVFGGSRGSSLAMHYAEQHPDRVRSLVLRGIWMLRDEEIHWWLYEMGKIQPELRRQFVEPIPEAERDDLLEAFWKRLDGEDREAGLAAAKAWSIYEGSCCTLLPNPEFSDVFGEPEMAWNLARLEAHYFRNVRFQPDTLLLDRVHRLRSIPAFAVHGRHRQDRGDRIPRALNERCFPGPSARFCQVGEFTRRVLTISSIAHSAAARITSRGESTPEAWRRKSI